MFVFPRPLKFMWKTRPMPRLPHTIKPDRDNCDKSLLDALASTIISDDKLACDGRITKWIAAGDEQPHVEVTISTMD